MRVVNTFNSSVHTGIKSPLRKGAILFQRKALKQIFSVYDSLQMLPCLLVSEPIIYGRAKVENSLINTRLMDA